MKHQKYTVNQHLISNILSWIQSKEIAIPEIQRPFVWKAAKVRDLMDSLYQGYPVGYLIAWQNPKVKLKDGSTSAGKRILIDGQQRVTALTAAILGYPVYTQDYRKTHIYISFHPQEQRFEVRNKAIQGNPAWVSDIAPIVSGQVGMIKAVQAYLKDNPDADEDQVVSSMENLRQIANRQLGVIELDGDLDIETVTDIFIRINSKGVVLSQSDFVMSKIAANETYGGGMLRKCIDYFSHIAVDPHFADELSERDPEFANSPYYKQIKWLGSNPKGLYKPTYNDVLRVAFTAQFQRGKLSDLVSLLSGRDFEKRTFEEYIIQESFQRLSTGVEQFVNQTNFERFVMIIKSAGYIREDLIRSRNALNFSYVVYLKLKQEKHPDGEIEKYVAKWLTMSLLTSRYSASAETIIDQDIQAIAARPFKEFYEELEQIELAEGFWQVTLPKLLTTTGTNSPAYNVYLAMQSKYKTHGLFSRNILVRDMIEHRGDIHHIFPRKFLQQNHYSTEEINQVANFAYVQSEINIRIGSQSPSSYIHQLMTQCESGDEALIHKFGGIQSKKDLLANMEEHDVPITIAEIGVEQYPEFLHQRRQAMAQRIRNYYNSL